MNTICTLIGEKKKIENKNSGKRYAGATGQPVGTERYTAHSE
jgi:hypothetical protein